jgi:hypothetical protein
MGRLKVATVVFTATCAFAAIASVALGASIVVAPPTVHRGHRAIIRGNAAPCPLGSTVFILSRAFAHTHEFAGVPAVLARVRSGGRFGIRPRIPAGRALGQYTVTARCGGGNLGVSAHLTVVA